eukprot:6425352-Prymnesium_polylepis.1
MKIRPCALTTTALSFATTTLAERMHRAPPSLFPAEVELMILLPLVTSTLEPLSTKHAPPHPDDELWAI